MRERKREKEKKNKNRHSIFSGSSSCQFSPLNGVRVGRKANDLKGFSGAKYSQTLSRLKALAPVNCLKARASLKSWALCLWVGTGLARLLCIPPKALSLWLPYGREKTAI